jgi:hypothetical protein
MASRNLLDDSLVRPLLALLRDPEEGVRQSVAVVDERTTPCCLGVHGQIVEMIQPFYTPDPPAWTDYQERPPLHDYCRTSTVLVFRAVADDDLTRDMRVAAALERQMREKPGYTSRIRRTLFRGFDSDEGKSRLRAGVTGGAASASDQPSPAGQSAGPER